MTDHRIVQCFGIKRRPHKPDEYCNTQYLWSAKGATSGNFGRKGTNACPNCGSLPDFQHPVNIYLKGNISLEEANALLDEYLKKKVEENKDAEKK